ncbi:MAG: cupin domain-containing protein [Candidatus Deferrimicrobiaceae bacterium]
MVRFPLQRHVLRSSTPSTPPWTSSASLYTLAGRFFLGREVRRITLGHATEGGEPVAIVPARKLQAVRSLGEYTLVACFAPPGFEFADFSIPTREKLLRMYPDRRELILSFTR